MAKQPTQSEQAAPQPEVIDPLALAKPLVQEAAQTAPVFSAGHQVAIDKRDPTRVSLHIPTDAAAFANVWKSPKEPSKPGKKPAEYLARTEGPYGGVACELGGRKCYVNLTIRVAD